MRRKVGVDASDIRLVLVVGAGTMGVQVALPQRGAHAVDVRLHDTDDAALRRAMDATRRRAPELAAAGVISEEELGEAIPRVRPDPDLASAAEADLVIECVPEEPALKGRV